MRVKNQIHGRMNQQKNPAAGLADAGLRLLFVALVFVALTHPADAQGSVQVTYMHQLSSFTSSPSFMWVNLSADPTHDETFVTDYQNGDVVIYNKWGMETFRFGKDEGLPAPLDVAVTEEGDIYVLTSALAGGKVVRCNYRGEVEGEFRFHGVPASYSDFKAARIFYRQGRFYLVDLDGMKMMTLDRQGNFVRGMDLADSVASTDPDFAKRNPSEDYALDGIDVDGKGDILFTISQLFSAFIVSPDGTTRAFGTKGSAPGKFGVVKGIVSDEQGYIYVADILRSVVLVFSPDLRFVTEFGGRGFGPGGLIGPKRMVINHDRLYVSQIRNRGVCGFRIRHD